MCISYWCLPVVLGLAACSMDVDVSQLQFAATQEAVEQQQDEFGPIECPLFAHCLMGLDGAPADPEACLSAVAAGSVAEAEALEYCRLERCGAELFSGSIDQQAAALRCLLENCTHEMVYCAAGRGESTCLSYAVKWQSQNAGTTKCSKAPSELCLIEFLLPVLPAHRESVVELIQCIAALPPGAVEELPTCLALCD